MTSPSRGLCAAGRPSGRSKPSVPALGALFGVAATGALAKLVATGGFTGQPLLVAPDRRPRPCCCSPIPASPLAQPRAILFGNLLSATGRRRAAPCWCRSR